MNKSTWLFNKNWKEIYFWDQVEFFNEETEYKKDWTIKLKPWKEKYIWIVWVNKYLHSCVYVWNKEFHIEKAIFWELKPSSY